MHEELDRLRRELQQRIFVGQPKGQVFVEARPAQRIEMLRQASRPTGEAAPTRPARKPGQAKLADY